MKTPLKLQLFRAILALVSITTLTARAEVTTYQGPRVKGVQTQNGTAVRTPTGAYTYPK